MSRPKQGGLPGFSMPIKARMCMKNEDKFPIAVLEEGYEAPVVPLREYTIMDIVNSITDKPDWHRKIFDSDIAAKWREEILNPDFQGPSANESRRAQPRSENQPNFEGEDIDENEDEDEDESTGNSDPDPTRDLDVDMLSPESSQWSAESNGFDISDKMADWAIAEAKYKAELFKQSNCVEALDGVWKSDTIIPEGLRLALRKAVEPLENVEDNEKDWHPGSNGQVLDIIHPSIYPFVYDQSRILPKRTTCGVDNCFETIGKGETLLELPDTLGDEWSTRFQWLPSEFDAPPDTEEVTTKSYINNLHPKEHQELYSIIPKFIAKSIPLWNRVLSRVRFGEIPPRVSDWSNGNGFGYEKSIKPYEEPKQEEGEDYAAYDDRVEAWKQSRVVIEPEPGEFKTPTERLRLRKHRWESKINPDMRDPPDVAPNVDLRKNFGRLQVIVKLSNIHLTPEKPEYPGGSWHVEGQGNESICATAIYYYSSSNITDSFLSFRQQVEAGMELNYPQFDHRAVEQIYGLENEGPTIQNLGSILTSENRLLCFPNVMQHRISPFRLSDLSKPGHRKILALFLVDPHLKIISTENVPPQQHSWWKQGVEDAGLFEKLPAELGLQVINSSEFPITLEKAREQREELMRERKQFVKVHNHNYVHLNSFNLCEH